MDRELDRVGRELRDIQQFLGCTGRTEGGGAHITPKPLSTQATLAIQLAEAAGLIDAVGRRVGDIGLAIGRAGVRIEVTN